MVNFDVENVLESLLEIDFNIHRVDQPYKNDDHRSHSNYNRVLYSLASSRGDMSDILVSAVTLRRPPTHTQFEICTRWPIYDGRFGLRNLRVCACVCVYARHEMSEKRGFHAVGHPYREVPLTFNVTVAILN